MSGGRKSAGQGRPGGGWPTRQQVSGGWSSSGANLHGPPGRACEDARLSAGGGIGVGRRGDPRPERLIFRRCEHEVLSEREDRATQPVPGRGTQLIDDVVNDSLRLALRAKADQPSETWPPR